MLAWDTLPVSSPLPCSNSSTETPIPSIGVGVGDLLQHWSVPLCGHQTFNGFMCILVFYYTNKITYVCNIFITWYKRCTRQRNLFLVFLFYAGMVRYHTLQSGISYFISRIPRYFSWIESNKKGWGNREWQENQLYRLYFRTSDSPTDFNKYMTSRFERDNFGWYFFCINN